jgi:hypothetical protein
MMLVDYDKTVTEAQHKIKDELAVYEIVKKQRNQYAALTQSSAQALAREPPSPPSEKKITFGADEISCSISCPFFYNFFCLDTCSSGIGQTIFSSLLMIMRFMNDIPLPLPPIPPSTGRNEGKNQNPQQ